MKQDFAIFEPPRVEKDTQIEPVESIVELPRLSPCVDAESPQLPDFQHEFAFIDTPDTINEPQVKPPKHEFLFLDDPPPIYNYIPDGYQKHPKYADYTANKDGKIFRITGCKESHFYSTCHLGKLKLTFTSPNIISTCPKNVLMSRLISQSFCNLNSSKNSLARWAR